MVKILTCELAKRKIFCTRKIFYRSISPAKNSFVCKFNVLLYFFLFSQFCGFLSVVGMGSIWLRTGKVLTCCVGHLPCLSVACEPFKNMTVKDTLSLTWTVSPTVKPRILRHSSGLSKVVKKLNSATLKSSSLPSSLTVIF